MNIIICIYGGIIFYKLESIIRKGFVDKIINCEFKYGKKAIKKIEKYLFEYKRLEK